MWYQSQLFFSLAVPALQCIANSFIVIFQLAKPLPLPQSSLLIQIGLNFTFQ